MITKKYECECGLECGNSLTMRIFPEAAFYGFINIQTHDGTTEQKASSNLSRGGAMRLALDIYEQMTPRERESFLKALPFREG